MRDIKITVIETPLNQALAEQYGQPNMTTCPSHRVGDVFISKAGVKPEGLCEEAWASLSHYVFALCHGAETFWGDWMRVPNMCINTCADGFRPAVFKLEPVEEEK